MRAIAVAIFLLTLTIMGATSDIDRQIQIYLWIALTVILAFLITFGL